MPTTQQVMSTFVSDAANVILHIAPERAEDLARRVFAGKQWILDTCEGKANFWGDPQTKTVTLSFSGLASLWCVAYAAYHIVDVCSLAQQNEETSGKANVDIGASLNELKTSQHLEYARTLTHSDQPWPAGLTTPNAEADLSSTEGRVNNVFYGALSWVVLHEVGHIYKNHVEVAPKTQRVAQEYEADGFATSWILETAGQGPQLEFRVVAICVALAWVFLIEEGRGQGQLHPATILRFREVREQFKTDSQSLGVEYASYVFKAIFAPSRTQPEFSNANDAFDWICKCMEELFPRRH